MGGGRIVHSLEQQQLDGEAVLGKDAEVDAVWIDRRAEGKRLAGEEFHIA
jgi:hypothetical protein